MDAHSLAPARADRPARHVVKAVPAIREAMGKREAVMIGNGLKVSRGGTPGLQHRDSVFGKAEPLGVAPESTMEK